MHSCVAAYFLKKTQPQGGWACPVPEPPLPRRVARQRSPKRPPPWGTTPGGRLRGPDPGAGTPARNCTPGRVSNTALLGRAYTLFNGVQTSDTNFIFSCSAPSTMVILSRWIVVGCSVESGGSPPPPPQRQVTIFSGARQQNFSGT